MARQALSRWLQPFFQTHNQIGTAIKGIASFFKTDSLIGKLRGDFIAEQTAMINKNKSLKRQRVNIRIEDDEPAAVNCSAEEYKGEVEKQTTAESIYSTSSERINFHSQNSKSDSAVFLKPFPVPLKSVQPRKKVRIAVRGFPSADPRDENQAQNLQNPPKVEAPKTFQEDAHDKAKHYVTMLKKTVTKDEFSLFKDAIKSYKTREDFTDVKVALETIMVRYVLVKPELLNGFKVFIKKNHAEEFDQFCLEKISEAQGSSPRVETS